MPSFTLSMPSDNLVVSAPAKTQPNNYLKLDLLTFVFVKPANVLMKNRVEEMKANFVNLALAQDMPT